MTLLLAATAAVPVGLAPRAAAATCTRAGIVEVGDLDADHVPDVVVGVPAFVTGSVDVRHTSANTFAAEGGDIDDSLTGVFGAALASIDITGDGCSELLIGAPGRPGTTGPGRVAIAPGSTTGLTDQGRTPLTGTVDGDGYGSALAVARRLVPGADDGDNSDNTVDIWVGAPGRTVDGVAGAGAVEHYVADNGSISYAGTLTAASLGGTPQPGARFGSVISGGGQNQVAIAAPDDTVSGRAGAGSVWRVGLAPDGGIAARQRISQDSPGVPGAAEAGDHFGFSLAGGSTLVVGVPFEDVGGTTDSGLVTLFPAKGAATTLTQNSREVPGASESGDRFGYAVTAGVWPTCVESAANTVVGVPGEDIGGAADAGGVVILPSLCGAGRSLTQGRGGLGGAIEPGDEVGAVLSTLRGPDNVDLDREDTLLVSAPGESLGGKRAAGSVVARRDEYLRVYTFSRGNFQDLRYGSVLTSPGGGLMLTPGPD